MPGLHECTRTSLSIAPGACERDRELSMIIEHQVAGSELVFVSGRLGETKIVRIPATGGSPIPLAIGEGAMDLSVSGDRLVFSRFSFDTDIWHLKLWKDSVPAVLPVSSTREDGGPQFSPEGQKIAFHSQRAGPSGIWVSAVDGSNALQVTGFDGVDGRGPRWSPDGKRLAFTARVGGDPEIYIVDAAGGNAQRVTVSSGEDSNPSWSADGQWIYFGSIRSGRTEIWKVSPSGGAAVQVTQNGGDGPVCFTRGYMYYRKGHPRATIFRVGLDGRAEEQVFEDRVWWNSWAIGERGLYFFTSRTSDRAWEAVLAMFDFSDRAVKDVAVVRRGPDTQQRMSVSGLALSPDESSILYDGRSRFDFDLNDGRRLPLNGVIDGPRRCSRSPEEPIPRPGRRMFAYVSRERSAATVLCELPAVQNRTPVLLRFRVELPSVTATGRWRAHRPRTSGRFESAPRSTRCCDPL